MSNVHSAADVVRTTIDDIVFCFSHLFRFLADGHDSPSAVKPEAVVRDSERL